MNVRSEAPTMIDLDANATTPVDDAVLEAMLPYFQDRAANASAVHELGRQASLAVGRARAQVAEAIGAGPGNVIFTSGATESDNLAIRGIWSAQSRNGRNRIITSATEHQAILQTAAALRGDGADVLVLGVDRNGQPDLAELRAALRTPTAIVSIMAANNETGVIGPIREVVALAHDAGALVHTDAAQVLGKMSFDVRGLDVDLVSLSAHKAYGPKGIGAIYVRAGTDLRPITFGGGQERGLRSGTLNVPGIVGFGVAAELAVARCSSDEARIGDLRDELWRCLERLIPGVLRNVGPDVARLPNTLSVRLPACDADDVLLATSQVAAATGSACAAGTPEPSHVLLAMGLTYSEARASIRFSLNRTISSTDIAAAGEAMAEAYRRVQ